MSDLINTRAFRVATVGKQVGTRLLELIDHDRQFYLDNPPPDGVSARVLFIELMTLRLTAFIEAVTGRFFPGTGDAQMILQLGLLGIAKYVKAPDDQPTISEEMQAHRLAYITPDITLYERNAKFAEFCGTPDDYEVMKVGGKAWEETLNEISGLLNRLMPAVDKPA